MRYYEGHLTTKLMSEAEKEYTLCRELRRKIGSLPEGTLHIRVNGDKKYYKIYKDKKEKGITKNKQLIKQLIEKRTLQEELKVHEKKFNLLDDAVEIVKSADEGITHGLGDKWVKEEWTSNPLNPEGLVYLTNCGISVRSKSERTIADMLYQYNLPFRYECEFKCGETTFWPDFTIRKCDGTVVLWEHFGMMSRPDYYYRALEKIRKYRAAGFVQHKNLICTWEEDLLDPAEIKEIITKFLM